MDWLKGDKIDAVSPRFKRIDWRVDHQSGAKTLLQKTIDQSRVIFKRGRRVRWRHMREQFEGLRDDMLQIEFINNTMLTFSLRDQWEMPK